MITEILYAAQFPSKGHVIHETAVLRKSGDKVFQRILRFSLHPSPFPTHPYGSPSAAENVKALGPESPFLLFA